MFHVTDGQTDGARDGGEKDSIVITGRGQADHRVKVARVVVLAQHSSKNVRDGRCDDISHDDLALC